jgi:hypothetical protein
MVLWSPLFALCQEKNYIKGTVRSMADSGKIDKATVAMLYAADTSLISYTLTDKNGEFVLHNVPKNTAIKIIISHFLHQNYYKEVYAPAEPHIEMGTILLSSKELKEVIISGKRAPISIRKDTIEFIAEAFKTRPNAVVEDLLKILPGIEVDNRGNIFINGKSVNRVLVDGRRYFGSNPLLATKNLDANMIDRVLVYDDRENDPDHLVQESKVGRVIDLKLKSNIKKSVFGKFFAGTGSQSRYEAGGIVNIFRDTLQISLIGVGNNLGKTAFSNGDLNEFGGFKRSGGSALYDGSLSIATRSNIGVESNISSGFNLNYDYGRNIKVNLMYFYSYLDNYTATHQDKKQFLGDTILRVLVDSKINHTQKRNYLSGHVEWSLDSNTSVKFYPSLSVNSTLDDDHTFENRSNNFDSELNKLTFFNFGSSRELQYRHNINFYHSINKNGNSLSFNQSLQVGSSTGSSETNSEFARLVPAAPVEIFNRLIKPENQELNTALDLTYLNKINNQITSSITISSSLAKKNLRSLVYDKTSPSAGFDVFLNDQSSDVSRTQWLTTVSPRIIYNLSKDVSLSGDLNFQWAQLKNVYNRPNTSVRNNPMFNILPALTIDAGKYHASFSTEIIQPDVYDIQSATIKFSPLAQFSGNPDLEPSRSYNGNISYYNYFTTKQISLNAYSSIIARTNAISSHVTIGSDGYQSSTPINAGTTLNLSLGASLNKRYKKRKNWQLGTNSRVLFSLNRNPLVLNDDHGNQFGSYASFAQGVTYTYKNKVDLNPYYSATYSRVRYDLPKYESVYYLTQSVGSTFAIHWSRRLLLEGEYLHKSNPQLGSGIRNNFNLFNFSISCSMLKKDNGQIKVSVYDLFNQNLNNYRIASQNSIIDKETNNLKQYFLITYIFKFNKTNQVGSKSSKR